MNRIGWLVRSVLVGLPVVMLVGVVPLEIRPLAAQDHERQPIYEGPADDISWSSDSQYVSFFDTYGVNPHVYLDKSSSHHWRRYDPVIEILTTLKSWPQQPVLTDDEKDFFRPTTFPDGSATYIFESPNKRYIVYCLLGEGFSSPLVLADRERMKMIMLDYEIYNPFIGPEFFRVVWSANSSAFVTFDDHYSPILRYVTNFDKLLTDVTVSSLNEIDYSAWDAFDLSDDGNWVLILGYTISPAAEIRQTLMVVNPLNLSETIILQTPNGSEITAAIFAPDNPNQILFVSEQGLSLYDTESRQVNILDSSIKAEFGTPIAFSPSGRWLAYQSLDGFFVIPMSDYLEE